METTIKNLKKYNVLGTDFRAGQEEYITKMIAFARNPDKKYLIFQGNVGIGKSLIALTASKYIAKNFKQWVALTSPKNILLDQYQNDYDKFLSVIKGGANYPCVAMHGECTYDLGPCHAVKDGVKNCKYATECPYKVALSLAKKDPIILTNMHLLLCASYIPGLLGKKRDILIIDEAHSLEGTLLDFVTITYSGVVLESLNKIQNRIASENFILYKLLKKYNLDFSNVLNVSMLQTMNYTDLGQITVLIDTIKIPIEEAENAFSFVLRDFDPTNLNANQIKDWARFNRDFNIIKSFSSKIKWFHDICKHAQWLCTPTVDFKTKEINGFTVKPINAVALAKIILPKIADKVIFMSATIGKKEQFCKDLGVSEDEAEYIETDSDFPKEKRPIYCNYVGLFNKDTKNQYLEAAVKRVDELLDKYPNYKGVIHTTSFAQCEYIQQHSRYKNRILTHTTKNKNEVVSIFMDSKNSVLCSPSCKEGLDLKGDLCRFQIIIKVPWGDLADKVVQVRMKADPTWYANEAVKNIEQAYGRGMRAKDDWCDCYILDQSFQRLLNVNRDLFSKYFLDAIVP